MPRWKRCPSLKIDGRKQCLQELRKLAADPNIVTNLIKSFAPSIWENEDVETLAGNRTGDLSVCR